MIAHSSDQGNWRALVAAVAADDRSGATAMLTRCVKALRAARAEGPAAVAEAARDLCVAQPSMAAIWNAAAAALGDAGDGGGRLDLLERRAARAGPAATRVAAETLGAAGPRRAGSVLRVVTCSASGAVAAALSAVGSHRPVRVACGEGRPAGEGVAFAADLAGRGLDVDLYTDAGLSAALDEAEAVVVGADALCGDWLMNKVGTRLLAAAAHAQGIAVYVVAGREKLAGPRLAGALRAGEGPAHQIEGPGTPGVTVRNPYFERVPWRLVTAWLGDMGALTPADMAAACEAHERALDPDPLMELIGL